MSPVHLMSNVSRLLQISRFKSIVAAFDGQISGNSSNVNLAVTRKNVKCSQFSTKYRSLSEISPRNASIRFVYLLELNHFSVNLNRFKMVFHVSDIERRLVSGEFNRTDR